MGGVWTVLDGQNARFGRFGRQVCECKQAIRYALKKHLDNVLVYNLVSPSADHRVA